MKEPRAWSDDLYGYIDDGEVFWAYKRPDEIRTCEECRSEKEWRWLLAEGPQPADWFAFCGKVGCKRGPTIIRSLEP